jgi:hypothetical protein
MGLQVTATETAKLNIEGTSTELNEVYLRLGGFMSLDGKKMNSNVMPFSEKAKYDAGENPVWIKEIDSKYTIDVDVLSGEKQGIDLLHTKLKTLFEDQGYVVSIVDLTI